MESTTSDKDQLEYETKTKATDLKHSPTRYLKIDQQWQQEEERVCTNHSMCRTHKKTCALLLHRSKGHQNSPSIQIEQANGPTDALKRWTWTWQHLRKNTWCTMFKFECTQSLEWNVRELQDRKPYQTIRTVLNWKAQVTLITATGCLSMSTPNKKKQDTRHECRGKADRRRDRSSMDTPTSSLVDRRTG